MGYSDFLRFSHEFGMGSGMGLSALDLGDAYLTVIAGFDVLNLDLFSDPYPYCSLTTAIDRLTD